MVAVKVNTGNRYDFYALEQSGKCEIIDFLRELERVNKREFEKLVRDFDWTSKNGLIKNPEKFKPLGDNIYEFKTHGGVRVLCFLDGRCIVVLTNGFMKKKKYDSEIQRAINLKVKYLTAKSLGFLTYREESI